LESSLIIKSSFPASLMIDSVTCGNTYWKGKEKYGE